MKNGLKGWKKSIWGWSSTYK